MTRGGAARLGFPFGQAGDGAVGILADVRAREEGGWRAPRERADPGRAARVDLWRGIQRDASKPRVVAWLRTLMTDDEPVSSAAAAASLSHWRRRGDRPVPRALESARAITSDHARSGIPGARQIALAANGDTGRIRVSSTTQYERRDRDEGTSLIVHGTAAYAGAWWFVGGDFHTYVRDQVRRDV